LLADRNASIAANMLNNILEMVMCYAFQSLPQAVVNTFFDDNSTCTFGLNVLPPLFQDFFISGEERGIYVNHCSASHDPHINSFPIVREQVRQTERTRATEHRQKQEATLRIWSGDDHREALLKALSTTTMSTQSVDLDTNTSMATDIDIKGLLDHTRAALGLSSESSPLVAPFGDPNKARIGVVLDRCVVHKPTNIANINNNICAVPDTFIQCHLTADNATIWTADLQQCFSPRFISTRDPWPDTYRIALAQFHTTFIQHSNMRVILLCGENAKNVCLKPETRRNQIMIQLQYSELEAYVESEVISNSLMVKRLYICIDYIHDGWRYGDWDSLREWSDVLAFITSITKTTNVRNHALMCHNVSRLIILRHHAERSRTIEPMTISDLDFKTRTWLALKGLKSDDQILMWEKLAGSLSKGLFLLLCTLPRKPTEKIRTGRPKLVGGPDNYAPLFSMDIITESKRLYSLITGKTYASRTPKDSAQDTPDTRQPSLNTVGDNHPTSTGTSIPSEVDISGESNKRTYGTAASERTTDSAQQASVAGDTDKAISSGNKPLGTIIHDPLVFEEFEGLVAGDDDTGDLTVEELSEVLKCTEAQQHLFDKNREPLLAEILLATKQKTERASKGSDKVRKDTELIRKELLGDGHWYAGHEKRKDVYHIHHWPSLVFSLKQPHVNHGEGFVIQVEISPPGNRHPKVFAKTARDSDPASRLAVKVTGKLDNGQSFEKYLVQGPRFWKGPYVCNAFFDWLSGMSLEQIITANEPRRFAFTYGQSPELKRFHLPGDFTDNSLTALEQLKWTKDSQAEGDE
jgi:hypothetical protein